MQNGGTLVPILKRSWAIFGKQGILTALLARWLMYLQGKAGAIANPSDASTYHATGCDLCHP